MMTDTKKRQSSLATAASQPAGTPTEVVSQSSLELQNRLVKSLIPAGAFRTDDHRYYFNGKGPVPSVTTILEILDKPALSTWKAQQAVKAIWNVMDRVTKPTDIPTTEDEAVRWALAEVRKTRDGAASLGSGVHHLADMVSRGAESDPKGFEVSEQEKPYVDAFKAFSARYSASSFVSSEKMVWSLNGYAGTYDLLMMIDGELWCLDVKTGKRIDYPEYRLQLAGYRWADWIILEGNPVSYDMPNIDRTGILHLRPDAGYKDGYALYDVPTTYESDYLTFLGLLEAWKWKQRKEKPQLISP